MLVKDGDLLWIAILEDLKLVFRQTADRGACAGDNDIDKNEVHLDLNRRGRRRGRLVSGRDRLRRRAVARRDRVSESRYLSGAKNGKERHRGNDSKGAEKSHGKHLRWISRAFLSCLKTRMGRVENACGEGRAALSAVGPVLLGLYGRLIGLSMISSGLPPTRK